MLTRILIAGAVVVVAAAIAWWLNRSRATRPVPAGRYVPERVDRSDFGDLAAPWVVIMFSSATCDSCDVMRDRVTALGADDVAVFEVEWGAGRAVHDRYGISAVPTTVVVDADGVVRASWVGKATDEELRAAMDTLRATVDTPDP